MFRSHTLALSLVLALIGCSRAERAQPSPEPPKPSASTNAPLVLAGGGIRFVKTEAGDDATKPIRIERERAVADGRDVLVYVGATWCEPCQRFHEAAKRGDLDGEFPRLTIVEFDADQDREGLATANYISRLIPLFVVPDAEGRPTDRRVEGGVKGDTSVAQLTPRLHAALAKH